MIGGIQQSMTKALDCKADSLDMQQQLDAKADVRGVEERYAERAQTTQMLQTLEQLIE